MLGLGPKPLLVIDPGRHTLKIGVGTLGSRGKSARLQAAYMVPTDATPQMNPDQVIERQGELLKEILKRHSLSGKHVSFSIPGRASFVRQLRIPKVSGDRLKRLIQYEARQQIPFPLEDIILDSHVFDSEGPELGVTLVAVRRTIIDQYCATMKAAGLVPDVIDVTTLSLFDAFYPQLKNDTEDVIALADIGASTTDIIVCKGGKVEFIRTAPQAGDQLTKYLSDQMSLSWTEAEKLKVGLGELDPTIDRRTDPLAFGEEDRAARVKVFLSKAFDGIANEIRRTLDFYVSQPEGEPIGKIYLTGGTSRCPGIAQFIESRLGTACEVKSPLEGTLVNVAGLQAAADTREMMDTTAAVLLGQCQRGIADVPLRMNFLPPPIVRLKDLKKRRPLLVLEGVGLAALVGFSVVTMGQTIKVYDEAGARLYRHLPPDVGQANPMPMPSGTGSADQDPVGKQIRTYIGSTRKIEERVDYLREIGLTRGVVSQTLSEVAGKLPLGRTWVESVNIDTTDIKLGMRGDTEQAVDPFKEHMKDVSRLREMSVSDVKSLGVGEGIQFSMAAKVEKNPSVELNKLREKLEAKQITSLDLSLEDHSDPPGSKQIAAIKVVVSEPFNDTERYDLVMKILRAEDEAQIGYESKTISIVFETNKRKEKARYDIEQESIQALLQAKMEVKDLTLKESEVVEEEETDEAAAAAKEAMEGMMGGGMMGGMSPDSDAGAASGDGGGGEGGEVK